MKLSLPIIAILTIVLAGACAPATTPAPTSDVNAIRTSAAYTVVAELTLTAASWTNTPLPPTVTPTLELEPPTATATTSSLVTDPTLIALGTPGTLCDSLTFGADVDVTIPDGTAMTVGQDFIKTWRIKNDGACAWGDGYGLIYAGYADNMSGQPVPLGTVVEIGQTVEVSVNFKAPAKAGEYVSAWQMANAKGVPFGKALFVKIIVQ